MHNACLLNYSSLDKVLRHATTTIWRYFTSLRTSGINPAAETLLWGSIGIELVLTRYSFTLQVQHQDQQSELLPHGPSATLSWSQTTPWRWGPSLGNQLTLLIEGLWVPHFQTYTTILQTPEVHHYILSGSFCHEFTKQNPSKIKILPLHYGERETLGLLWGSQLQYPKEVQPPLKKKKGIESENFVTVSTFIFTKQLIKSL